MKTTLTALLMLASTLSFAQEITKEEYFSLFVINKVAFEEVKPGMTSEYSSNYFTTVEEGAEEECRTHEKKVVISTENPDKYLVYNKSTLLNDCGMEKKGTISENLTWESHVKIAGNDIPENDSVTYKKILKKGNLVTVEATDTDEEGEITEFTMTIDITKSQFYNIIEDQYGKFQSKLLRRGYIDPASINIENLEITDYL